MDVICFWYHHLFLRCVDRNLGEIASKSLPSNRTSDSCNTTTTHKNSMIRSCRCAISNSFRGAKGRHEITRLGWAFCWFFVVVTFPKTSQQVCPSRWDEIGIVLQSHPFSWTMLVLGWCRCEGCTYGWCFPKVLTTSCGFTSCAPFLVVRNTGVDCI